MTELGKGKALICRNEIPHILTNILLNRLRLLKL